jgi:hypothetical protein
MSLWITRWARNGGLVLQNAAVSLRAKAPAKKGAAPSAPAEPAAGEGLLLLSVFGPVIDSGTAASM